MNHCGIFVNKSYSSEIGTLNMQLIAGFFSPSCISISPQQASTDGVGLLLKRVCKRDLDKDRRCSIDDDSPIRDASAVIKAYMMRVSSSILSIVYYIRINAAFGVV